MRAAAILGLPVGRRWHRLKQAGYSYNPNPDGSTTWTTPLGRSYTSAPPFTPPVLREQPRDPDEPPPGPPEWARRELLRADPPRSLAELRLPATPGERSRAPGRDDGTGDRTPGSDPPGAEPPRPALPEEPPF